ncbi:MAG: hypothetical protein ACR2L1_09800 [Pyrinomonadaceae bacterium]
MEVESEANDSDIFSGCGNGVLDVSISRGITADSWDASRGDRWIDICLDDEDLEAISLVIFRVATGKPYNGDDNILKLRNYDRQLFARIAPEFPMLGRINYIYADAYFTAEEVKNLRDECVRLKLATKDSAADLGLRKLIYSCDEAIKVGFCLGLCCD